MSESGITKRGGKRPGSGAKAKDGATLANTMQVCARIFTEQHGKWLALGGSAWLRGVIDNAELTGASAAKRPR